ncbi:hypothetical protein J1614_009052 [Plenodomus biglobosus]|nr:hypothetical protein J1614_009052 [Plenodomus biglobosus]
MTDMDIETDIFNDLHVRLTYIGEWKSIKSGVYDRCLHNGLVDTLGETCGVLAEFRLDEDEMECIHGGPGGGFALLIVKDAQVLRQGRLSRLSGAVVVAQAD